MTHILSTNNRVEFTAHAPLHTFVGWSTKGLHSEMEIDFKGLSITRLEAAAETMLFETGDQERTTAMRNYFSFVDYPQATFVMTECRRFHRIEEDLYQVTLVGILEIGGIRRQLPLNCRVQRDKEVINFDLDFKWSFKAYGLKAPRLLFLTVRDIVDIKVHFEFVSEACEDNESLSE